MTGTLAGIFTINDTARVDEGGFSQGTSDSHIDVTYTYDPITASTPEPASILLMGGGGLLAVSPGEAKEVRRKRIPILAKSHRGDKGRSEARNLAFAFDAPARFPRV